MVTDWRKEEIIDWSKPIETLEGKKLSYVGPFVDGKVVVESHEEEKRYAVCKYSGVHDNLELSRLWFVRNVREEQKMTIDWTKPIETLEGEKVFYIGHSSDGSIVVERVGMKIIYRVDAMTGVSDSRVGASPCWDVRNVRDESKIESRWINIYENEDWGYKTKKEANERSVKSIKPITNAEVIFKDGKPIDIKLHQVDGE